MKKKDNTFKKTQKDLDKALKMAIVDLNGSSDETKIKNQKLFKEWRKGIKNCQNSLELFFLNIAMISKSSMIAAKIKNEFQSGDIVQKTNKNIDTVDYDSGNCRNIIKSIYSRNNNSNVRFKPFNEELEAEKEKYLRLAKTYKKTRKNMKQVNDKLEQLKILTHSFNRCDMTKQEFLVEFSKILDS